MAIKETSQGKLLFILALYCCVAILTGSSWAPFGYCPNLCKKHYYMEDKDTTWQMNSNNIAQSTFSLVTAVVLNGKNGLQVSLILGTTALFLQCTAFAAVSAFFSSTAHYGVDTGSKQWRMYSEILANFGSVCGGIASAFITGSPSQLSATWFPSHLRGRTTALAYMANYVGVCISNLGYSFVEKYENLQAFQIIQYSQAGIVLLLLIITISWFPKENKDSKKIKSFDKSVQEKPLLSDNSNEEEHVNFLGALKSCLLSPSILCLIISNGIVQGTFQGWSALLPIMFEDLGNSSKHVFSSHQGDQLAFYAVIGYAVAGYFAGEIADRFFQRRLKRIIIIFLIIATATSALLFCLIPGPNTFVRISMGNEALYWTVSASVLVLSVLVGAAAPVTLELCAEISYPIKAGITANTTALLSQIVTTALTFAVNIPKKRAVAQVMHGIVFLCFASSLLLCLPIRAVYKRKESQQ
eukprot:m.66003 g.66003  ORF g.66003 m.66003 type:complete len:469 (-) comp11777_c0_seq2:173-1579(-)